MENIIYLSIIFILLCVYYKIKNNENFSPVGINYNKSDKPDFMKYKIDDHYFSGKIVSKHIELDYDMYLYGKPYDIVHKLYSYKVIYVKNDRIVDIILLNPNKKYNYGDTLFVFYKMSLQGPYILE